MKNIIISTALGLLFVSCASKNNLKDTLVENPDILTEAMKKNPEKFMIALQETAELAREQMMKQSLEQRQQQIQEKIKGKKEPKISKERLLFGKMESPVKIVKYADFQCPACRMGYDSLNVVKKKYGDKIAIVHKHVPLEHIHPLAREAAWIYESLIIADKNKAQKFYEQAYQKQGQWRSKEQLWELAEKVGAKKETVNKHAKKIQERIVADIKEHQSFGFEGTPAYVINGVAMYGAQSPEAMSQVIEAELKKK